MNNLPGILLMVFAMLAFAIGDAAIKELSRTLPLSQIMGVMGVLGTLVLALYTRAHGDALLPSALWHPALLVRFCMEITAAFAMTFGLSLVSLSLVSAVLQATPLVVTLGAALWFGENVGWRRWSAVLIGFVGVLILLRPGGASFDATLILPVIAMAALALRDLATRAAPAGLTTRQLSTVGFFAFIPAAALMQLVEPLPVWPDAREITLQAVVVVLAVAGYFALTAAMRVGEISAVAPFRYARLIFGMGLGIAVFGERPDFWMYVGAGIIVLSGLYTFFRERRLARVI